MTAVGEFDQRVRSPTGTAWMATVAAMICAGEIAYEMQKAGVATFFSMPFADDELLPVVVVSGIIAAVAAAWLASLYLRPGRFSVSTERGALRRELRPYLRRRVVAAPAEKWQVRVLYFSEDMRQRGSFKRIELRGPEHAEVLLFGDLPEGEALAAALDAIGPKLGTYEVEVERGLGAKARDRGDRQSSGETDPAD